MIIKRIKVVKCKGYHVSTDGMRKMGYKGLEVIPKLKSKSDKSKKQSLHK